MMLSEMQQDALTEFFNICVGQAAGMLSEIVNRKIKLSIPVIDLLSADDITASYFDSCIGDSSGHVMSSSLQFGQEYNGKAFLLFPVDQAKLLVNICLNEISDNAIIYDQQELLDTDFDVIKEIGNIILNSVVGGLGNLLVTKLTYSLPEVEMLFVSTEKQADLLQNNIYAFMMKTMFSIENTQFSGTILIIFGMDSVTRLIAKIDDMLEESDAFTS
ncbi:chemotaxis protein CheC [Sporomusaceae bacterium BoRhaA]|uniref:chemotaxis protein CheC n=1 Tax=Pelorhabdus rhamnosifermentans TaxID=2772457 RepID=UPI001C064110|nr:chemotaxis protein CheC [Pelorhabdus rhamnosifermentans]MBU2699353.1 chemotaxis protein CheC [Pelorhabdus rhamnosifermentans]